MTDINAGDWVVAHKGTHWTCDVSKVIEVDLPYIKIEQPFGFNTAKWRSVDDFRPATPAESAAGHRIDESVCTCPIANSEELRQFKNYQFGYSGKPQQWQYGFDLAWQHQQAVVDELRKLPPFIHTIIVKDGDTHWFAQALNIDYAACGMSLDDVQRNFEKGLRGTIDANLSRFKNISRVVNPNGADIEHVLGMTDSQQRRIEELQKRVGAVKSVIDKMISKHDELTKCEDGYHDAASACIAEGVEMVVSALQKAIGADHDSE